MEQELKKTNITSNNETSRYIMKKIISNLLSFWPMGLLLGEAKGLQQNG
jgi:hypothetical protein